MAIDDEVKKLFKCLEQDMAIDLPKCVETREDAAVYLLALIYKKLRQISKIDDT